MNDFKLMVVVVVVTGISICSMASCEQNVNKEKAITIREAMSKGYIQKQNAAGTMEWIKGTGDNNYVNECAVE
jgi:hypothetical protein